MTDDNVFALPVKPRPDEDPFLCPVPPTKCGHLPGSFEVDLKAGKCVCKTCGEEVSPMHVLERLMQEESRWRRARDEYHENMRRLAERSRVKCQHCGEFTRISTKK